MDPKKAVTLFDGTFTEGERDFLLAHPEFQQALSRSGEDVAAVRELHRLGVRLVLGGEYNPPPKKDITAPSA